MNEVDFYDTITGTRIGLVSNGTAYCHEHCATGAGRAGWIPLPPASPIWEGSGCLLCGKTFRVETRPTADPFQDHYL